MRDRIEPNALCGSLNGSWDCGLCGTSLRGLPCWIAVVDHAVLVHLCASCREVYEALRVLRA